LEEEAEEDIGELSGVMFWSLFVRVWLLTRSAAVAVEWFDLIRIIIDQFLFPCSHHRPRYQEKGDAHVR
jgi:hypothetical protein